MPRFYFHLRDGEQRTEDPEGSELPDLTAARGEAIAGAREVFAGLLKAGKAVDALQIEICDDAGRTLATVAFQDALKAS